MYTDEDLYSAADRGIFPRSSVDEFKRYMASSANTNLIDEENFRLVSGFNDIFVSISCAILVVSSGWLLGRLLPSLGFAMAAVASWGLALFFIKKKRLALPSIVLLVAFIVGVINAVALSLDYVDVNKDVAYFIGLAVGVCAAYLHWRIFYVPITVAAGMASLAAFLLAFLSHFEIAEYLIYLSICTFGLITFFLAMYWDAKDTNRSTRQSDTAFWLHLLAAPLFVHPIFLSTGFFSGEPQLSSLISVVFLYLILALISIVVDRRALMVSSLVYVLYAFQQIFSAYGIITSGLAVAGVLIGSALLVLSAFWYKSRKGLLRFVPVFIRRYLPPASH